MTSEPLVTARLAESGDQALIATLAALGRDEIRPTRGGELLLDHDFEGIDASDRVATALSADDEMVVVGRIDQVIVGYALVRQVSKGTVRVAHIDELLVHPQARAVGVAAAMLQLAVEWARINDCTAIESQVLPGNRDAKNFFERVGMVTRQMRVSTSLTD